MRAIILKLPYKLRWKMEEHCLWTAGEAPPSTRFQLNCQFHWEIMKMEIRSHRFASTKKEAVLQLLWQFSNSNPNVKGSASQILVVSQNGPKKFGQRENRVFKRERCLFCKLCNLKHPIILHIHPKKEIKSEDTQQETPENSRIVSLKTWGHIL